MALQSPTRVLHQFISILLLLIMAMQVLYKNKLVSMCPVKSDIKPFEKQPDNYFCPVCGAPKRRFRPYAPVAAKNANDLDVRKACKAQLKRDETLGKALPIAIAVGVVALVGLYFYLNSSF